MLRPVLLTAVVLALVGVTAPAHATPAYATPETKQPVATGTGGAVSSVDLDASRAGIEVLRRGGNAIDAAVAVASTLGVTEPFVAGPGGGGFMVIYLAATHRIVTIDGRETCPATCTPQRFLDATGTPLPFEQARRSGLSVGVPGMVATWAHALARYGRRSLASDLQPAIATANRGFLIDANFVSQEQTALADLQSFTSSRELFLTPDGQPLPIGSTLKNPDLARTYQQIAAHGAGYLYDGALGADIVQAVQHPPVAPGTTFPIANGDMTRRDLADYVAKDRTPTHVTYRGLDVYSMPPPSSGGSTVGEALNILSAFDLAHQDPARAAFEYLEASRLAFADRNAYVGDSDYVPVPLSGLLDPAYAATRSCVIHDTALTSPVAPGHPYPPYSGCGTSAAPAAAGHEGQQTNHLSVVDRWGNVVAYTNTIEQIAGSGITVPGRGFLLNNELTDFDFAPAAPGAYDPNLPAPGKRPRSSMSPTIVLRGGAFDFTLGSPGGSTIITTVLQTLLLHVDFGLALPDAIAAPRASQRNTATTTAEQGVIDSDVGRTLVNTYGEVFTPTAVLGNVTAIQALGDGVYQAAAEPVRGGGGSALVLHPR